MENHTRWALAATEYVKGDCVKGMCKWCRWALQPLSVPRARPDQWLEKFSFLHHVGSLIAKVPSVPRHARRPHTSKNLRTLARSHICGLKFHQGSHVGLGRGERERWLKWFQHKNRKYVLDLSACHVLWLNVLPFKQFFQPNWWLESPMPQANWCIVDGYCSKLHGEEGPPDSYVIQCGYQNVHGVAAFYKNGSH